ncbi:MAG: hypothetical protein AAB583_02130 [Patescibacteria group bacterium]
MRRFKIKAILNWYEKNYTLNVGIASFLFLWQLIHLYWLTVDVVLLKLFGVYLFHLTQFWQYAIIIVDYTEIPSLILVSFIYVHSLSKKFSWKSVLFLLLLNSQWVHLFWITDEFVVRAFLEEAYADIPLWLAWVAILIDYLELPVIFDTLKKFFVSLRKRSP